MPIHPSVGAAPSNVPCCGGAGAGCRRHGLYTAARRGAQLLLIQCRLLQQRRRRQRSSARRRRSILPARPLPPHQLLLLLPLLLDRSQRPAVYLLRASAPQPAAPPAPPRARTRPRDASDDVYSRVCDALPPRLIPGTVRVRVRVRAFSWQRQQRRLDRRRRREPKLGGTARRVPFTSSPVSGPSPLKWADDEQFFRPVSDVTFPSGRRVRSLDNIFMAPRRSWIAGRVPPSNCRPLAYWQRRRAAADSPLLSSPSTSTTC